MRVSSEQDRREAAPALDGRLVGGSPGVEQLDQLLARAVVVPFAVAAHDLEQMVERFGPPPLAVAGERQVEARLVVERIGRDFLLQFADRPDRFRLLGEFERGAGPNGRADDADERGLSRAK